MTLYWKYLGPGFDSRHLHQLFTIMQKLFENFRKYVNEAKDPDTDGDDKEELLNMAPEINKKFIEDMIMDFSFNAAQSSSHRWSRGQPMIDYKFDNTSGTWRYAATIPGEPKKPNSWEDILAEKGEDLKTFLTRVKAKAEEPLQLNLGLQ